MNTSKLTIFCFALVAALASASVDKCWTETRKCRYEAKASGYKCKDYYPNMYARCHPIMKYEKVCEKPVTSPAVVGKPKDMTVWDMEKSKLVPYSKNYGPKCPSEGTSDYYETKNLPKHPINYPEVMAAKPTAAAKPKYAEKTAKPYVAPNRSTLLLRNRRQLLSHRLNRCILLLLNRRQLLSHRLNRSIQRFL